MQPTSSYYIVLTVTSNMFFLMAGFSYELQLSASPSSPYQVGQNIELSYSISPQPAVQYYIVLSVENYLILYQTIGQSGNWTWTVDIDNYQSGILYCAVYINDFTVVEAMEVTFNGEIAAILSK